MHNRLKGLDYRKASKVLKYFGFVLEHQTGSHQHWIKDKRRVELIAQSKSFSRRTLRSMIEQSGFSEGDWVLALDKI